MKKLKDKLFEKRKPPISQYEIYRQEENFIDYYVDSDKGPIKLMLKLYSGHYKDLALAGVFLLIKSSPGWLVPIFSSAIIAVISDTPLAPNGIMQIILYFLSALFLIILNIPTHLTYIHFFSKSKRSVEAGLRGAMVRKLQQLSISFQSAMQSGKIQSKIMRDVENIEGLSTQIFELFLSTGINLIISLGVILISNWIVFLFFIAVSPIALIISRLFKNKLHNNFRELRQTVEKTSSNVMDMIELIPVTRAHAVEKTETAKITNQLEQVAQKGYKVDIVSNLFAASNWVVFTICQMICLSFTAIMAYKGFITVAQVVLYQTYFSQIIGALNTIFAVLPAISRGVDSVNSIGEILSSTDIESNKGKTKLYDLKGEYEFKNVGFKYNENSKYVLKDFSLKVNQGETVAFVGESGAGKSTVLNMIIGFIKATEGEVLIDGLNVNNIDLRSYRSNIAVVPQNTILFSGTIRDNITYGMPNVSEELLNKVIKEANLESFLKTLPEGIDTYIGEHGGRLSGGQRQRISIARAIIRNPKVIIFDEATSALDSVSEKEIQDAIENLTSNRTTFIVAHRLSTIRNADKIAFIKNGRCSEYGTYKELMDLKGDFYNLKKLQS